jgi:hypothetical protein
MKSFTSWYSGASGKFYRITTLIGHPLKNATYFLFSIPIAMCIFRRPFNFIFVSLLFIATFVTGSRAASILAVISLIFYYVYFDANVVKQIRTILAASVIILISYFSLLHSPLGSTLVQRFAGEGESSIVRVRSLANIGHAALNNIFVGSGVGSSFDSSSSFFGYNIGYENPWIMLIVDVGIPTTLLYFGIICVVVLQKRRYLKSGGLNKALYISFISTLTMITSYNSFGSRNTLNFLLWLNVALLFSCKDTADISISNIREKHER